MTSSATPTLDHTVALPDGRSLHVVTVGDPAAPALVYHPGTPCGPTPQAVVVEAAHAAGRHLVTIARPGYPGSTPQPGRTAADAVADTEAALDALGHGDFHVLGWSGGGPHALACAARSDRCRGAAVVAGVGPYGVDDLDFFAGMDPTNEQELTAAAAGRAVLSAWITGVGPGLATITGADVAADMSGLLSPADRALLTGDVAEEFAAVLRESFADGVDGWLDDDLAFVAPWGFDPAAIAVPVDVWQGGEDAMVPAPHGDWLAAHVPTATPHLFPAEGHLSVAYGRMTEIVATLVGRDVRSAGSPTAPPSP